MISEVAIFVKCQVTAVATLSASSMRTNPRSLLAVTGTSAIAFAARQTQGEDSVPHSLKLSPGPPQPHPYASPSHGVWVPSPQQRSSSQQAHRLRVLVSRTAADTKVLVHISKLNGRT